MKELYKLLKEISERKPAEQITRRMYKGSGAHPATFVDPDDLFGNQFVAKQVAAPLSKIASLNEDKNGVLADVYIGGICGCRVGYDLDNIRNEIPDELLRSGHVAYNILLSGCGADGFREDLLKDVVGVGKEFQFYTRNHQASGNTETSMDMLKAVAFFRKPMIEKVRELTDYVIERAGFPAETSHRLHIIPSIISIPAGGLSKESRIDRLVDAIMTAE